MKCREITDVLEKLSPKDYALSWDNVGLLVGDYSQEVKSIAVALDADKKTINKAIDLGVDMLITHHPMIFSPVKSVVEDDLCGKKIIKLISNKICYYAMHTNFDIMGSMANLAAEKLCLLNCTPLEITHTIGINNEGIGKIGELKQAISVTELAELVKSKFQLQNVFLYGDGNKDVKKIAISPGSGKSMIKEAVCKNADVLITGDIGHHEGIDAVDMGLIIIDATHYGLEHIFTDFIANYLEKNIENIPINKIDLGSVIKVI